MLNGSWPVEQPADQSRIGGVAPSFRSAETCSAISVKWAGSRKNAVWLTVERSIKSCMPGPVGSTLSNRSLNWVKLVKPFAWSRERSRACKRPMRCGSRVMPMLERRKATIGAKSDSDQGSGGVDGGSSPGATSEAPAVEVVVEPAQGREHAVPVEYEQESH